MRYSNSRACVTVNLGITRLIYREHLSTSNEEPLCRNVVKLLRYYGLSENRPTRHSPIHEPLERNNQHCNKTRRTWHFWTETYHFSRAGGLWWTSSGLLEKGRKTRWTGEMNEWVGVWDSHAVKIPAGQRFAPDEFALSAIRAFFREFQQDKNEHFASKNTPLKCTMKQFFFTLNQTDRFFRRSLLTYL